MDRSHTINDCDSRMSSDSCTDWDFSWRLGDAKTTDVISPLGGSVIGNLDRKQSAFTDDLNGEGSDHHLQDHEPLKKDEKDEERMEDSRNGGFHIPRYQVTNNNNSLAILIYMCQLLQYTALSPKSVDFLLYVCILIFLNRNISYFEKISRNSLGISRIY